MQNKFAILTAFEDKLVLPVIQVPVLKIKIYILFLVFSIQDANCLVTLIFEEKTFFNAEIINRHPPNATKLVSFPNFSELH